MRTDRDGRCGFTYSLAVSNLCLMLFCSPLPLVHSHFALSSYSSYHLYFFLSCPLSSFTLSTSFPSSSPSRSLRLPSPSPSHPHSSHSHPHSSLPPTLTPLSLPPSLLSPSHPHSSLTPTLTPLSPSHPHSSLSLPPSLLSSSSPLTP